MKQNRVWLIVVPAAVVVAFGLGRLIGDDDAVLIGGFALIVVILVSAAVGLVRHRRRR